jgi:hypothetical protein
MFPSLAANLFKFHQENPGMAASGHDFDHDLRVAEMAALIAPDEATAYLAAAAGFCHSADRFVQVIVGVGRADVDEVPVKVIVNALLATTSLEVLPREERQVIVDAVMKHGRPNEADDNLVLKTLKDADRIVNCDPDVICRSTRHHLDCPNVDYVNGLHDPAATYKEPLSVLRDISHCLEWTQPGGKFGWRLQKAGQQMAWRAEILRAWIDGILRSRKTVDHYYNPDAAR